MIPKTIICQLRGRAAGNYMRAKHERHNVDENLKNLGVDSNSQFAEFFAEFCLTSVRTNTNYELLDLCTPTNQIFETTEWAQDVFGVPEDFICLTSGEGEGFILYSKSNEKVYNIDNRDIPKLTSDDVKPRWETFYELINWYLQ